MSEPTEAQFMPNYNIRCDNCHQTPTVDVFVKGTLQSHMELCGPCCFGEAACIDPENW